MEGRTAGPSATSGFPVRLHGVDRVHAAFLTESRIRGRWLVQRVGNPESAPTARRMTKFSVVTFVVTFIDSRQVGLDRSAGADRRKRTRGRGLNLL